MRVSFLVGGTEPAGCNQLFFLLGHHRDLCLPVEPQPEPNFFSKRIEYRKGIDYYHRRYFAHHAGQSLVGEKSGRYLWHPDAAGRIREYNPEMKIIFILRDPVDRAWSNYRFNGLNGIEPLSFRAALEAEPQRCRQMAEDMTWRDIQPYAYFDKGLYARQLRRYLDTFDRSQIHVLHNEALRANPRQEVQQVLRFLGLSPEGYEHADDGPQYPSYHVRSRRIQSLIRRVHRPLLERAIMKRRSGTPPTLAERLVQCNLSDRRTLPDPDLVAQLRARYAEEMRDLAAITHVQIVQWTDRSGIEDTHEVIPASPSWPLAYQGGTA